MGHRQKLLWPGEVRRKREDDSGRTEPALFAGSNNQDWVEVFFLPMPYLGLYAIAGFANAEVHFTQYTSCQETI